MKLIKIAFPLFLFTFIFGFFIVNNLSSESSSNQTDVVPSKDGSRKFNMEIDETAINNETIEMKFNIETPEGEIIKYSQEELNYFLEITLGSEWNDMNYPIRKWTDDPRISVFGEPTSQDHETIKEVIEDVNNNQNSIELKLVDENPNVEIYFVPLNDFGKYVSNPMPGNWGLFYYGWDGKYNIDSAKILISIDKPNQIERSHLIREELTQSLGLVRDSYKYKDSMFYQEWTTTTEFSEIDRKLIQLLYDDRIKTGMTKDDIINMLKD